MMQGEKFDQSPRQLSAIFPDFPRVRCTAVPTSAMVVIPSRPAGRVVAHTRIRDNGWQTIRVYLILTLTHIQPDQPLCFAG